MTDTQDHQTPFTTTDAGVPVASDEHSLTVGPDGRSCWRTTTCSSRWPTSTESASGARAARQGRRRLREVPGDRGRQRYTWAAVFPGHGDRGRDPVLHGGGRARQRRHLARPARLRVKFYTSEGNFDLVGNNTPVFFVRDPMKFQHFIRKPEAARRQQPARPRHAVGLLDALAGVGAPGDLADGRPRHPAHLAAHERILQPHLHVDQRAGERFWVKYHFKTDQGVECFTQDEADEMAANDTDYHQRDLLEHIRDGDHRAGRSTCRSCRSRTRRPTGSTRST